MAIYRVQIVTNREQVGEDVAVFNVTLADVAPQGTATVEGAEDASGLVLANLFDGSGLQTLMHTSHVIDRIKVYDATALGQPLVDDDVNIPGTASSELLPLQVAMSLTYQTAQRKRWGRSYLPGLTIAALATNSAGLNRGHFAASACQTAVQAAYRLLLASQTAGMGQSIQESTPPRSNIIHRVTGVYVDNVPDVQRRRRAEQVVRYIPVTGP